MNGRRNHHEYRYKQHHLWQHNVPTRVVFWVFTFAFLAVIVTLFSTQFQSVLPRSIGSVFSRISIGKLLSYGLFTFLRLLTAYVLGLVATAVVIFLVSIHEKIEAFLVPILDILQSVPVLAFFPLIIIAFADLHAPEFSALIVLFMAMTWSVMFGALGGLHQIPEDIFEAAEIYGAKGFKKFTKIIFPSIFPNLVTGSILSFGAGWNVIIISEYINYGRVEIRLPGLGNLLSSSAGNDPGIFLMSLITLVLIITLVNRFVWHRLTNYSEKFKFE